MRTDVLDIFSSIPTYFQLKKEDYTHTYSHENEEIVVTYHSNGLVQNVGFRKNGKRHRPPSDGPACIFWCENGQKHFEEYYVDGFKHPARIFWYKDGRKSYL